MSKNIDLKKNLIIILFIFAILFYTIYTNYIKYTPARWMELYGSTTDIDKISNFSFWWYTLTGDIFGVFVYIFPIILVGISISSFFKIYHTGYFQYIIQRTKYKKAIKCEILKSWGYSLVLPVISLLTLFISKILYTNSIISKYTDVQGYRFQLVNEQMETMNPYLFIFLHIILIIIFSIIIINIAIICTRYFKNTYLVTIASYISIICLENFNNLILAPIIASISGNEKMYNGFSLYNLYYLDAIPSLLWEFIFAFLILFSTLFLIYKIYRKKESICLDYE